VRVKDGAENRIDAYKSADNGSTWVLQGPVADTGALGGNPPMLLKLRDGRLCVTYGYRAPPYSIRARTSSDSGKTWGPVITIRDGAATWELGYPRSIQRPDGKIVTIYYFNDGPHNERFVAATIWSPVDEESGSRVPTFTESGCRYCKPCLSFRLRQLRVVQR